jgi:hypothetical protein
VATATPEGVWLWEVATGRLRYHRKGAAGLVACSPDGHTLALAAGPVVRLIDARADKELGRLKGHEAPVQALAFTPDGKALVSGAADSTALVWDVARLTAAARPAAAALTAKQRDQLWADLAGEDAGRAFLAMTTLWETPKEATALLAERLKPVPAVDAEQMRRRLAGLEDDSFDVRQGAAAELERLGELARPALEDALKKRPSADLRRRVEDLLSRLRPSATLPAEELRCLRAVEVLEGIGTPEAKKVLRELAKGARGARQTREAVESLKRLGE